jgi:cysteinyl-tRNA synthetase
MGHPRKQLNFTLDSLHAAESAMTTLHSFWQSIPDNVGRTDDCDSVFAALHDDLNTPGALGALFTIVKRGPLNVSKVAFEKALFALGLKPEAPNTPKVDIPAEITALAAKRWAAKQAKDFAAADALRKELAAAGWSMLDSKTDYKLEPLKK